jgi:ubiquinone/menaquinone biosynthesis C-methylase UbiE
MISQKSYFDNAYSGQNSAKIEKWRVAYLQRVYRSLDIKPNDMYLDIGCGGLGYIVIEVANSKQCYSVGVDISSAGARQAASIYKKRFEKYSTCEFVACSATHLPFRDASFSKITLIMVLEHVPNDKLVISEIGRICQNNGKVLVTVPNSYSRCLPVLTLAKIKADKAVGHLRSYKAEDLLEVSTQMGFVLKSLEYHAHFIKAIQSLLQRFPLSIETDNLWWVLEKLDYGIRNIPTGSAFTVVLVKR